MRGTAGALAVAVAASVLGGCGDLKGFGGPAPPLVTFQIVVNGDPTPLRPPGIDDVKSLKVALVWGEQWLTEPFCILPPESDDAKAVIAAGCRDPFGFVPQLVAASVPVDVGVPTSLSLFELPGPDVMVGPITSRVAYASLVVYDERGGDTDALDLAIPHRTPAGGMDGRPMDDTTDSPDIVYGASFVTMTAPDQRVAYSEGTFNPAAAFYPRSGCYDPSGDPPDPPNGFSVLAAGGFSYADGLASALAGTLPAEDPTQCNRWPAMDGTVPTTIEINVQAPSAVQEVGCTEITADSTIRYRRPPTDAPDLTGRTTACAHLPSFDAGGQSDLIQLVVSGRKSDRCMGLTHYTLRGCRENVSCAVPDWDYTANPPSWWPQTCL